jgi:hypothetical protein
MAPRHMTGCSPTCGRVSPAGFGPPTSRRLPWILRRCAVVPGTSWSSKCTQSSALQVRVGGLGDLHPDWKLVKKGLFANPSREGPEGSFDVQRPEDCLGRLAACTFTLTCALTALGPPTSGRSTIPSLTRLRMSECTAFADETFNGQVLPAVSFFTAVTPCLLAQLVHAQETGDEIYRNHPKVRPLAVPANCGGRETA